MRCILTCVALLSSMACSPVSKQALNRNFRNVEQRFQDHTGFVLYDVKKKSTVFTYNGEKYFTPASNTKIFTFYTALTVLGDSVPGLYYAELGDSLIFWGSGDPSFLYDRVAQGNQVFDFLKDSSKELFFSPDNFSTTQLGPGWAWSDYNFAYSAERSPLPVYGNTYIVTQPSSEGIRVTPPHFKPYFWLADSLSRSDVVRELGSNRTDFYPGKAPASQAEWRVPFRTDPFTISNLLEDTLKKRVTLTRAPVAGIKTKMVYNVHADSLYKVMMQASDNFIAEQLLLVCAGVLSDTLKPEIAIRHMKRNQLSNLADSPVWVDGSGLSRYNLFTPRSIVSLWEMIYGQVNRERLFQLLAVGGKSGTLRSSYVNDPPYIYGKTGTLSNNHSLSGFLITRKGEVLIFSYMSSNFTVPVSEVRKEMERILKLIHEKY